MNRYLRAWIVVLVVFLAAPQSFAATSWGELSLGLGYSYQDKLEHASTETGFKLAFEESTDFGGKLHLSAKGMWDWKTKDGKLTADQLWLSGYSGALDYTIGRQLISWGTADGFNPTNYFSRLSSTSALSGDLSGAPFWSAQATYYGPEWSLTGVVVPFFTPQAIDPYLAKLMTSSGPQGIMLLTAIENTKQPRGLGKNSELAVRAETQLAGFDLQASFFSGFEPLPGMELILRFEPSLGTMVPAGMEGIYRRQNFVGLAAAGTVGPMGVWAEISYGGPEEFQKGTDPLEMRIPLSTNKRYLQAVLGGDCTIKVGGGLLVQAQYIYRGQGSLFAPYIQPDLTSGTPGESKPAHYLYGRVAYDFTPDNSLELVVLHGFGQGQMIRPAYTHRLFGSLQLELSMLKIRGEGELATIPAQGRLALKYSF